MCLIRALVLVVLAPICSVDAAVAPPISASHGHYVVLGQAPTGDPMAIARVVMEPGYKCPAISDGEFLQEMVTRDNIHNFDVIVCEALLEFQVPFSVVFADGQLPLPQVTTDPQKIIVLGNTGCEKLQNSGIAGCAEGENARPFEGLAVAVAAAEPDLMIHTGNYNIRGTPEHVLFTENHGGVTRQIEERVYDAGAGAQRDENCAQDKDSPYFSQQSPRSNSPDTWKAWKEDFFAAAGPAISVAPWVLARGSHELCSRGGAGWYYFLDPHSNLVPGSRQVSCPVLDEGASAQTNELMLYPYVVDFESFGIVVFDSSNACSSHTNAHFTGLAEQQLEAMDELAESRSNLWLLSHKPVWGVAAPTAATFTACVENADYACVNQTLQTALRSRLKGRLPDALTLVLAGNLRQFQSVTFDAERPPTITVGNGGVSLVDDGPVGAFPMQIEGRLARVLTTGDTISTPQGLKSGHGYLDIERAADGEWSGRMINPTAGFVIAECGSAFEANGSVCVLASGNDASASGKIVPDSVISEPLR